MLQELGQTSKIQQQENSCRLCLGKVSSEKKKKKLFKETKSKKLVRKEHVSHELR